MKIALFTETYLPQINGVVTHVKILKEGLEKLNHEVLIVTADANAKEHYIQDGILHCPAIKVKKLYNYGLAFPLSKTRLEILKEFNPDVIHIHNEFGIGLSGIKIAKELKKPLIYTLHTIYDDYIYYIAPKPFIKVTTSLSHGYARYLSRKVQYITSPSDKGVKYLCDAGVKKEVKVIPNSAELDIFVSNTISDKEKLSLNYKYNIPTDVTKLCFVGRLGKEKNVETLLNFWAASVKENDKLHLLIIGDGPEYTNLLEQTNNLGLTSVTFTGSVEHYNLPLYYNFCDAYITTSLSDTNSISMLEAMAVGLPVLSLEDPLNEGQVIEGLNGFIFKDANEMYLKLKKLQSMEQNDLDALRNNVIISVSKSGSTDLAENVLSIYRTVVNESNEEVV